MVKKSINVKGELIDLGVPKIMGILNATPDSFFSGSRVLDLEQLKNKIQTMLKDGVDIFDVGGYSTRPGAVEVSVQEEIDRVVPVIELIKKEAGKIPISIDTFRSQVAEVAVGSGAGLINDVSGGNLDQYMFETVAKLKVPYILMHMRGRPETMPTLTLYHNVVADVIKELQQKVTLLKKRGVADIMIDPGFGFAKTLEQNYELLKELRQFEIFKFPILVGISRKKMITQKLGILAEDALNATTVLNTVALMNGASILRVHDVKEAIEVRKVLIPNILR